jgi:hypothetical protein
MAAVLLLLVMPLPLQAADIMISVDHDPVGVNETFTLTFELNQQPDAAPDFSPLQADFDLINQGQSSSFSIINGRSTTSIKWNLVLRPRRTGVLKIPPIQFGSATSPESEITAVAAAKFRPQRDTGSDSIVVEAEAAPKSVYVQQQIIYTVRLLINTNISSSSSLSPPQIKSGRATIEQLGKDAQYTKQRQGVNWQVVERRYAVTPQQSGLLEFEPIHFEGQQVKQAPQQPGGRFDPFNMFSTMLGPVMHLFSDTVSVEVKPQPPGFSGTLWLPANKVTIEGGLSLPRDQLKTGEPATLTVTIAATGLRAEQLAAPQIDFPSGLKSYPDEPLRRDDVAKEGVRGVLAQRIAVVPTKAGSYQIPAIEIPWWNIDSDKMEIARLEPIEVTASGAAVAADTSRQVRSSSPEEKPAAAARSGEPAADKPASHLWKGATLALALLWLLSIAALLWFFKLRKGKPHTDAGADHHALFDGLEAAVTGHERALRRKVMQAAHSNDPQGSRDALLKWGASQFPNAGIHSLSSLADVVDGDLAAELQQLNLSLYSNDMHEWSGAGLAESMHKWRKTKADTHALEQQEAQLPPLHKL